MGGRVSQSGVENGSDGRFLCNQLLAATISEKLQLNRLVQVTGSAFGYWFPKVFCV